MTRIFFSEGTLPRWGRTEGLRARGLQDIAVPCPWPSGDVRDRRVARLLTFLMGTVVRQGKSLTAGQTTYYGWTLLRFRESYDSDDELGAGLLVAQETQEPLREVAQTYSDGATRAVTLLATQEEAIRRNHVAGDAEYPHRTTTAAICTHVPPLSVAMPGAFFMQRGALSNYATHESGWFIGCADREHDHNASSELGRAALAHLVARYPRLFPYLGMPAGTVVSFEGERTVVFAPGEDDGHPDDAPPFTGL